MTQDLEIYLTTCQVGITASSIAVGVVAEPALAALFEPVFAETALAAIGSGAILAFLLLNLVHLTLLEGQGRRGTAPGDHERVAYRGTAGADGDGPARRYRRSLDGT